MLTTAKQWPPPGLPSTPNHLYVSTTGNDSNTGTSTSQAFRTITKAASMAGPGTTVHVLPGTYTGGIRTLTSGNASNPVIFLSETQYGAKIVPGSGSTSDSGWTVGDATGAGDYCYVVGFEVDGTSFVGGTPWRFGIYHTGTGSRTLYNKVHDIFRAPGQSVSSSGGAGIYADSYRKGINQEVSHNVIYNIGPDGQFSSLVHGIYHSSTGQIRNNMIFNVVGVGIHLWHDARSIDIVNNTVFNCRNAGIMVGNGLDDGENYNYFGPADNCRVINNISVNNGWGIIEYGATGTNNTYSYNLTSGNTNVNWQLKNGLTHSNTLTSSPGFLNYTGDLNGDYTLSSTSPALDSGTTFIAPAYDLFGVARPQGSGIDRGAFERVSTSSPPPPPVTPPPPPPPTTGPTFVPISAGFKYWPPTLPTTTNHLYVAPNGLDTNAGTQAAPFKTLAKAASVVTAGTTVHVASGVYEGGVKVTANGTASAPIIFLADTQYGAKLVHPVNSTTDNAFNTRGAYIYVVGFEIDGTTEQTGTPWNFGIYGQGNNNQFLYNIIHDLNRTSGSLARANSGNGGAGIINDLFYNTGSNSVINGNIVYNIGPADTVNNLIHGIYLAAPGLTCSNNLIWRAVGDGISSWHDASTLKIINNSVFQSNTGVLLGGGGRYNTTGSNTGSVVSNNILYANNKGVEIDASTVGTYTINYNYVDGNSTYNVMNGVTATATVTGPVNFRDWEPNGAGDYIPASDSPNLDTGTAVNAPALDIRGVARPQGTAVDIGAFEREQTTSPPPPPTPPTLPPSPPPPPENVAYALNVGNGSSYTAVDGTVFGVTGATYTGTFVVENFAGPFTGTDDQVLFQTGYRGAFTITIPIANGYYDVETYHAETYFTAPNQRVFNIRMQGNVVDQNVDLYALAGGNFAAQKRSHPWVNVSDGTLTISFESVVDVPVVMGVRLLYLGTTVPPAPPPPVLPPPPAPPPPMAPPGGFFFIGL